MSPVPLFSYSPPPGATLESRKNELIIYCLVVPWPGGYFWPPGGGYPKKGLILASWGVGQKRANFGLPGVPPRPRGYTPRTGTFSHLGTPYPQASQASPRVPPRPAPGTPQASPRVPPQASPTPQVSPTAAYPCCGIWHPSAPSS